MTRTTLPGAARRMAKLAMVLAVAAATAAPAVGQYGTYIVPGSLAERREQSRDALLKNLQDARWRWGPVRIDPQLSIGNVGWVDNIYNSSQEEAEGDLRAQAAAGLRASINLGPKIVTSAFVDASYSWWRNQDELRNLNESYGLLLLGMFNRLQVQLQGGRVANQSNLSSEVEAPVDLQADRVELSFDVDPRGPLVVFGGASKGRIRYFGQAAQRADSGTRRHQPRPRHRGPEPGAALRVRQRPRHRSRVRAGRGRVRAGSRRADRARAPVRCCGSACKATACRSTSMRSGARSSSAAAPWGPIGNRSRA